MGARAKEPNLQSFDKVLTAFHGYLVEGHRRTNRPRMLKFHVRMTKNLRPPNYQKNAEALDPRNHCNLEQNIIIIIYIYMDYANGLDSEVRFLVRGGEKETERV